LVGRARIELATNGLREVDFPEFSRHSIMSKLNWRVVNET